MNQNVLIILLAVVFCGLVLAFIVYFTLRFLRGTIKLSLPSTTFNPGDRITGSFDLHAKKAIQGNKLIARLTGLEETRTREQGKTRTRSHEIYRDEVILEEAKSYPPGFKATYNFEIPTPDLQSSDFLKSKAGQMLTGAINLIGKRSTRLKWKITIRLEAKGINLATSQWVSINIR